MKANTGADEVDLGMIFRGVREIDAKKLENALGDLREAVNAMNSWHSQGAEALASLTDSLAILDGVALGSDSFGGVERTRKGRS